MPHQIHMGPHAVGTLPQPRRVTVSDPVVPARPASHIAPPSAALERLRDLFRCFADPEEAVILVLPDAQVVDLTDAARALLGRVPTAAGDGAVGTDQAPHIATGDDVGPLPRLTTWVGPRVDSEWLTQAIAAAAEGESVRRQVDVRRPGDGERTYDLSLRPLHDDDATAVLITAHDVTESRRLERESALLMRLTVALAHTDSVELAIRATLREIGEFTGWLLGEAWIPRVDPSGETFLERAGSWCAPHARIDSFASQGAGFRFRPNEGLPGRAWAERQHVWVHDLRSDPQFTRGPLAARTGLRGAVALPLLTEDGVVAVLQFFLDTSSNDDERLVALASAVAAPLALLIQQKQSEERHLVAETRLEGMISIATDAIISIDRDRRITMFNWGAERIFGYSADEVIGRELEMLLPPEVRGRHAQHVARFAASADTTRRMGERSNIMGLRKNGEIFPAEASISRFIAGGEWTLTAILRDVSDRARTESGLRFLNDTGETLVAMLDDLGALQQVAEASVPVLGDLCVIDVVTPGGRIEAAGLASSDPAVVEAIRAQRERAPLHWDLDVPVVQAMRRNETLAVPDTVHALAYGPPDVRARAELARELGLGALLSIPLRARGRVVGALTVAMARSGRALDDSYRPVAEALASRIGLAVENVELYQQSREAVNARDQIMAVVSHDLRNPLSAVSMCLSGLRDQPPPSPANVERLVTTAESALDLSFRLIQDLLDVAAIDAGRLSLARSDQPLDRVIARAVDMLRNKIESAELELTLDIATTPPLVVNIDAERMIQVLANLIGNAVKFTESGGAVRIGLHRMGDEAWVTVTDTGCGIAEDALPHVFDRFFHTGHRGRERSTGLGLAIAKGIVEVHGGRVWAESRPGIGSTFYVALPLVRP